jgi:hypothetical protein
MIEHPLVVEERVCSTRRAASVDFGWALTIPLDGGAQPPELDVVAVPTVGLRHEVQRAASMCRSSSVSRAR